MSDFNQCGKVFHLTRGSAEIHAQTLVDEYCNIHPNVYKCPQCGMWHVGFDKAIEALLSKRARRKRKRKKNTKGRRAYRGRAESRALRYEEDDYNEYY